MGDSARQTPSLVETLEKHGVDWDSGPAEEKVREAIEELEEQGERAVAQALREMYLSK